MENWLESYMFSMTLRTKILQMAKERHIFVHLESEQIGVDTTDMANIRLYKRLG